MPACSGAPPKCTLHSRAGAGCAQPARAALLHTRERARSGTPDPRTCVAAKLGGTKAVTEVMEELCEALDTVYIDFTEDTVKAAFATCMGAPDFASVKAVSPGTPDRSGMPPHLPAGSRC